MTEIPPEEAVSIEFNWTDVSSTYLNERIAQFLEQDQYFQIEPVTEAIQFLRGVAGRATFVLPAYYAFTGSRIQAHSGSDMPYWKRVESASLEQSSISSITLSCRAIFDAAKSGLTGKRFALASDAVLEQVAHYYAKSSGRPVQDATAALILLRNVFRRCSDVSKSLIKAPSLLERRIGLLKMHADREAAHITLSTYVFAHVDVVHVVAAIAILGAMIVDFDAPTRGASYFDQIDEASWRAARNRFLAFSTKRLFDGFNIHEQGRLYWQVPEADGLYMLLTQLPAALGYWESQDCSPNAPKSGGDQQSPDDIETQLSESKVSS